jgi:hypothetical protein
MLDDIFRIILFRAWIGRQVHCVEELTTVRVLKDISFMLAFIYKGRTEIPGCERFESFMRFSPSRFLAKLLGCTPESLFSLN